MSEPPDKPPTGEPVAPTDVTRPWSGPGSQPSSPSQQPFGGQTASGGPTVAAGASAASQVTRDRVAVHLVWEGILLVLTAALVVVALLTTNNAHFLDVIRPTGYAGLIA